MLSAINIVVALYFLYVTIAWHQIIGKYGVKRKPLSRARHFAESEMAGNYGSKSITVLKGLEPVRKRPGMYIGSTGWKGLHHLVYEIVDNSVDESLAGHCTEISVTISNDGSIKVMDNGRGIPCDFHPSTGKSTLETVLCVLHAGGKFGGDDSGYKVSGGLHGVGLSVVNALSDALTVEVVRDDVFHTMHFSKGIPLTNIITRPAIAEIEKRGTTVIFKPDPDIFKTTLVFEFDKIAARLDELAYLNAGLTIHLTDMRPKRSEDTDGLISSSEDYKHDDETTTFDSNKNNNSHNISTDKIYGNSSVLASTNDVDATTSVITRHESYRHDGGVKELVEVLCQGKSSLLINDVEKSNDCVAANADGDKSQQQQQPQQTDVISIKQEHHGVTVEAALRWSRDHYQESLVGFANGIRTSDGGSHLDGFKSAITKTVNNFAKKSGKIKEGSANIPGEFIREGLTAVVSVKVPEPEFEGQTKTRLGNPEVRVIVDSVLCDALQTIFEWNPALIGAICNKAMAAQTAAIAAKAAREMVRRKSLLQSTVLPGKLADCASRNAQETEIYIVEGDSAAGSAKLGRDRRTQAILPLKGKILNIEKASSEKIYSNTELQSLISALGLGVRGVAFNKDNLRYHRIVIMTDADVDGAHIRLLLLTFFYRYQPELLTNGYIYIACPPLYKVTSKGSRISSSSDVSSSTVNGGKTTPREVYVYDQESMDRYLNENQSQSTGTSSNNNLLQIQRFKGLGEMMPLQLWETTMDPARRMLKLVTIENAAAADRMFSQLMGDEVHQRRDFIISNVESMKLSDFDY